MKNALIDPGLKDPTAHIPSIPELNALHSEATEAAANAKALGEFATRKAILLGLKLSQLKEATPHGQWESLFATSQRRVRNSNVDRDRHLLNFSNDTARNYIAVATKLMAQRLTSEQSQALLQLADHPANEDLTASEIEFLEELTPEKSLRQLYINLGIIKPTRKELHAMEEQPERTKKGKDTKKLSLAEIEKLKNDDARKYWFGTTTPGNVDPDSLLMWIQDEIRDPAENHLHRLKKPDLDYVESILKDALKLVKQLIS